LFFAVCISLLAGICFGLMPALKTARSKAHALKEGGRGGSARRHGVQHALVAAEMALALVLLIGAGLMIRTLTALWSVSPGFEPKNILTFGFSLPPSMAQASADAVRAALREVHEKFQSTPNVEAVSFSWGALPLSSDDEWLFWIDGEPKPGSENDMNWTLNYVVEPDYLNVMRIPLRSGRFFTIHDDEHAAKVAVIDDALAKQFFGNIDPLGKRLHINSTDQIVEIVGVVGHIKQWGLDTDDRESLHAQLYTPLMQLPDKAMAQAASGISVLVRSQNLAQVFQSIRTTSQHMSSEQVVFGAQTLEQIIANSLAARRFSMTLLAVFAALALALASVGIYGVVSYAVSQRTQEIGVRMAMGAQRSQVMGLVLTHGATMAALGSAIGLFAAFALTRLMGNMLFGISAADPMTYACVVALLFVVSIAACWIPARRAASMNPVVALRYE
jgi:predicted permease